MSLEAIKSFIEENDSFAVIGHVNPDGDCVGSCMGLWHLLKMLGKEAFVMIKKEEIPPHLRFVWNDEAEFTENFSPKAYIAVDCGDIGRLIRCGDDFEKSGNTACIDHHRTNGGFASVSHIVPDGAAAGELVYRLIADVFGIKPSAELADCLYAAISSDTGSFKYSSVTPSTLRAAADLLSCGADNAVISKKLFDTYSKAQLDLISDVASTLTTYFDGLAASITVTDEMLEKTGITFDQADFLTGLPRAVEGTEVGIFFKKRGDEVKVSLRSNERADVSKIAASLGGGGHIRAAGVSIKAPLDEAKAIILNELEKVIYD